LHVAETVIELDVSEPWVPPEPPAPRRRLRTRWVASCAALAVACTVLAAAGAAPPTGPRYEIEDRVLGTLVAGDLMYVNRYEQSVSDPRIDARRISDGKVLWSLPADFRQQFAAATEGALILVRHDDNEGAFSTTLTAVDPADGRRLWTRTRWVLIGVAGDLLVTEELPEPRKQDEVRVPEEEEADLGVNRAGDRQARHVVVLDARTGRTVWERTVPASTVVDYSWDGQYPVGSVTAVDELQPSGLLTRRDTRSGAVVWQRRLDWSGNPAWFTTGASWLTGPRLHPGRAVVYPDGQRGGIVFDLADGRVLFPTDIALYDGLYVCTASLFCTTTGQGIATFDITTGSPAWRLDGYTQIMAAAADRLVVTTFEQEFSGKLAVVDARTGAVVTDLAGWRLIQAGRSDRLLVWRPADPRTGLLGELDPVTGRVTVFGRADRWYGPPECSAAGDAMACVMVGTLTVWRLPARHRGADR
jgi:outer membrane protein assembly factor BamB